MNMIRRIFHLTLNLTVFLLAMIIVECGKGPDPNKMRSEILELHKEMIAAHLEKDVNFVVRDVSDKFLSVSNGEINRPSKEILRSEFENYLNNTTFQEYRDLQEPIIGFSEDGSTAWSIVQVKISGKTRGEDGMEKDLDFICAWITLYRREGDRWIRTVEVSNFK